MTNNKNRNLRWILPYIAAAWGLLFAFVGFSEFYNVKFAGRESAYPFGPINENPWYYQSASVYAGYNLVSGLLFLAASLLTVGAAIKKNKPLAVWGIGLIFLFFTVELISSSIQ
jgi:predicted ATP-grasp superfamily ATP-dependent carboligase